MNFSKSFDQTLRRFGISGKWLAEQSGVSPQMISGFRRGQQRIYTDSLEKVISALPSDARQYFYESILGRNLAGREPNLEELIEEMGAIQLATLLNAVAARISAVRLLSDESDNLNLNQCENVKVVL